MNLLRPAFVLGLLAGWPGAWAQEWQPVVVPGEAGANHPVGTGWYRCWVKVPDNWATLGGRDLWVESVTLTIDSSHAAHEAFINGKRLGGAGSFPPDAKPSDGKSKRYKVPPGSLTKGKWNELAIKIFNRDGLGQFRGNGPSIQGYFLECLFSGEWEYRQHVESPPPGQALNAKPSRAAYDQFHEASRVLFEAQTLVHGERLTPSDSLARFELAEGLAIETVLHEPFVTQPTHLSFDARGRLWVSHYVQYPYPAGLRQISRDKYYRAKYDRQPKPPPHHTPGRSRVTVHEDTDGDGDYDTYKVFVDKLSLANAALPSHDGVWVMHTPHLLFYPDRNADDIPDGDPVVHLAGFGFEDTHSVANGLAWGPDGWLYGAQGSTVSCRVTRPGIDDPKAPGRYYEGCMVWRYHPDSREFEIFAEGGGNVFGLEFDTAGRLFSGHNGGGTRGFHYVQSGLYLKQGKSPGKFGPPDNPFAFGELPMMPGGEIPRFSHSVIAVNGSAMPDTWQGKLLGADPLHRHLVLSERSVRGASFATRDVGFPVKNSDVAFRPVYMVNAPDGSVLIADFYERYIAHGQHYQSQIDPTSGRIYRLHAEAKPLTADTNLRAKTDRQLIDLLAHPNKWHRQTAVGLLGQRANAVTKAELQKQIKVETGRAALHGLWALHQAGGLDDAFAAELLRHPFPHVRVWAVRLCGDQRELSAGLFNAVRRLAKREGHPEVRSQIAGTAIRLPRDQALGLAAELLRRTDDIDDPFIPLQCWWVIERHCEADRGMVLELFRDEMFFRQPMVERHILERLMRRLAARGRQDDFIGCAELLKNAPTQQHRDTLMTGFSKAFEGQALPRLPDQLVEQLRQLDNTSLVLRVRLGDSVALGQALTIIVDTAKSAKDRVELIRALGDAKVDGLKPLLLSLVQTESDADVVVSGLLALQRFSDQALGQAVVDRYPNLPAAAKPVAISFLASRLAWSHQLLAAVESGSFAKRSITASTVGVLLAHGGNVAAQARNLWPSAGQAKSTTQAAEIARVRSVVEGRPGSPYRGRELYMQRCAACHKLFHKGGQIGPNLTHYQRTDLDTLLPSILDPSREIREGFEQMQVQTRDGRLLSGFLTDRTDKLLILRGTDGSDAVVEQSQVKSMEVNPRSLMPDGLLVGLSEQQLRDFFAYLRIAQPIRN